MLETARTLRDEHHFLSGRKISYARGCCSARLNPFAKPFEWRAPRLAKKVAAGAQFIQTSSATTCRSSGPSCARWKSWACSTKFHTRGVGPLRSAKSAEWIRTHVPGVHIRMRSSGAGGRERRRTRGPQLCIDLIQEIRTVKGVHGVHVMAYRQEETVTEIIERSGVLGGRVPCTPGATRKRIPTGCLMTDTVISSATREVVLGLERPFVMIGERINPTGADPRRGDGRREFQPCRGRRPGAGGGRGAHAGRQCRIPLADERRSLQAVQLVQSITDVPLSIDHRSSRRWKRDLPSTRASRWSTRSPEKRSGSSRCCRW